MSPRLKYEEMRVDELRERARKKKISGVSRLRKAELIEALTGERPSNGTPGRAGAAKKGAAKKGAAEKASSRPVRHSGKTKYSQEIRRRGEREERKGRSLITTNHDVIRRWAEERKAVPAAVPGTEHGDRLGVLRFDFPGYGGDELRHVSWDEWFETFDARQLNFIYQEHKSDGAQSNFFRLENPEREDA